jgi:HEAT repeat protein
VEVQERVRALLDAPATQAMVSLRTHAALVLAERSDATGVAVLASALDSCGTDILLCKRVIAALGRLKDARAVAPLVEHLAFVQTRRETVEALADIGDTAAVGPLIGCLERDAYVPVRAAAASALGRIGGARAVQGLRTALVREREEAVLSAVRTALAAHGQGR